MILRLTYKDQTVDIPSTTGDWDPRAICGECVHFAGWTDGHVSFRQVSETRYEADCHEDRITAEVIDG